MGVSGEGAEENLLLSLGGGSSLERVERADGRGREERPESVRPFDLIYSPPACVVHNGGCTRGASR